jgi:hypothetical protein
VPDRFDDAHIAAINSLTNDRGWIVNCYAQVEFLIADLVVRCREFDEYAEFTATLPYKLAGRVRRFSRLLEASGPLDPFRDRLQTMLRNFMDSEERRQFLVHGFATFEWNRQGDMGMSFVRFMPEPDDPFCKRTMMFRPATLTDIRETLTAQTTDALDLMREIHSRFDWQG